MKKDTALCKLFWMNFKKFLSGIKKRITGVCSNLLDRLDRNVQNIKDEEYRDLTPSDEIENGKEYFNALDWSLKNEKITNIALAGPYGSGKSSIIRAYSKMHPSMKTINISLASFLEVKVDEKGKKTEELVSFDEDKIEEGILKQLFYKVDFRKIPQSRYRKLHNVNGLSIFRNLFLLVVLAFLCVLFFLPDVIDNIKNVTFSAGSRLGFGNLGAVILVGILVLTIIGIASYIFWWMSTKYKLKELNIADRASISANNEDEKSIFNKNMDEIVYFFEATTFDIVFIEDLDRFKSAEIFIKLRELNTILNNYELIKRRIVFIYAIKDDMFTDKERTKFFDFIIPVIPIINSTNSGELLLECLKAGVDGKGNDIYKHDITPGYITSVSPYIEDMRVLINIYNEFLVYKNTLRTEQELKLFDEPMMSLMIFKNLYPKDFADLQLEEGIVKKAFKDKKDYITEKVKELVNEKNLITETLESIEQDILSNIKEIKVAMLYYLTGENGMVTYININGEHHYFSSIMDDNFDLSLLQNRRLTVYYLNQNGGSGNRTVENINILNDESGNKVGFIERVKYLKESTPERIVELQDHIVYINEQIHKIGSMSLNEILAVTPSTEILSEDVRSNKLLVFMLRNGYIDDKYVNYMNYFHANSITKDDMNFILSVRNHESETFTYPLTKRGQVVERLLEHEFEQKEIYNFDILEYLLMNKSDSKACQLFIDQLSDEEDRSWDFIDQFVDRTECRNLFINLLGEKWVGMWDYIFEKATLTDERKTYYFKEILINVNISDIEEMNFKGNVVQYMEENADILKRLNEVSIVSIVNIIDKLKVMFNKLEIDDVPDKLLEFIFDNCHYELNYEMIKNIVKMKSHETVNELSKANYTTLLNLGYKPLLDHLDDYFEKYVKEIVIETASNTEESIDSVITILRKIILNPELSIELIRKENILLQDFTNCCIDLIEEHKERAEWTWKAFLDSGKVVPSWKNIMTYWEHYSLTGALASFIRTNINDLIEIEDKESVSESFIKAFLIEDIEIFVYKKFAENFKLAEFDIAFSELSSDQMQALLECRYFEITPNRYLELKESHSDLCFKFILDNKINFLSNISEYELEVDDAENLIEAPEFSEIEKLQVLNAIDVINMTENIAYVIRDMKTVLEKDIINMAWSLLPKDKKYQLFLNQITTYSLDELEDTFREFNDSYDQLADRTRRHNVWLADTDYNRKLAEYLDREDYLSSYRYETKVTEEPITFNKIEEKYIVCIIKAKK